MALTKAAGLISVRALFSERGASAEAAFLEKLTPEEAKQYRSVLPISWVPIELADRIFQIAAPLLWPGLPTPLRELGRVTAKRDLTTIYKVIAMLTTLDFILGQAAKIWQTYHKQGNARAERSAKPNEAFFVVENYPDLPDQFREMLCGYIQGVAELTGAKQVRVQTDYANPNAWRWVLRYE